MDGRRIQYWTAVAIVCIAVAGGCGAGKLWGIAVLVPALAIVLDMAYQWRYERQLRREMRAWLDG